LIAEIEDRSKGSMSSKKLGIVSVSLSVGAVVLTFAMRFLPGLFLLAVVAAEVAAVACAVLAARRGSKLCLIASALPLLYVAVLLMSILAE
jgi:hypothetical protein